MLFDRLFKTGEKKPKLQTNSNKDDLIRTVTAVGAFAKRNRFFLFFPGTVQVDDHIEVITAILITRSVVYGINCFGYGGTIEARDKEDWVQILNGKRTRFASPAKRNEKRQECLEEVLRRAGLSGTPSQTLGVFTSPSVELNGARSSHCFTEKELMEYLKKESSGQEKTIDVKKAAFALEPFLYREEQA